MNDKMREALVAALSTHSSEGQFKVAAVTFFELARKEGFVLDDFLSLTKLQPTTIAGIAQHPPGQSQSAAKASPLTEALRRNIAAATRPATTDSDAPTARRSVNGVPTGPANPFATRTSRVDHLSCDTFDWMTEAPWLDFPPDSPRRNEHQRSFMLEQGRIARQTGLPPDIDLRELCQHYLWFSKYKGWYMVEVPSGFYEWLLRRKPAPGAQAEFKITERGWQVIDLILDCRDQGILPSVPEEPFGNHEDSDVEWCPLSDLV